MHDFVQTFVVSSAADIAEGMLVKLDTVAMEVTVCGAGDVPIGSAAHSAEKGDPIAIKMLIPGTIHYLIASKALATAHAAIYTAADGEVQDITTATLTLLGKLVSTATADQDRVYVLITDRAAASVVS